jgi:hypothetical protein
MLNTLEEIIDEMRNGRDHSRATFLIEWIERQTERDASPEVLADIQDAIAAYTEALEG